MANKILVGIVILALILGAGGGIYYFATNVPSTTANVIDIGDGMFCEDSDGGYKPFKAGWVRLTVPSAGYTDDKVYDYCIDSNVVAEYTCEASSGVNVQTYDCDAGCSAGRCEECISEDHKQCYGGHVYWFDSCGVRESKAETCSNGCSNGECEAEPEPEPEPTPTECDYGENKCDGNSWMTCTSEGTWTNNGIIKGKCNVNCKTDSDCEAEYSCEAYDCVYSGSTDGNDGDQGTDTGLSSIQITGIVIGIILLIVLVIFGLRYKRRNRK